MHQPSGDNIITDDNGVQELLIEDNNALTTTIAQGPGYFVGSSYTITQFSFATLRRVKDAIFLAKDYHPYISKYGFTGTTAVYIGAYGFSNNWAGYPRLVAVGTWR